MYSVLHVSLYRCIYVHIYVYTYTHIYIYIYIYIYFWAPDFCVYMEPSDGRPVLVASLSADNTVKWESTCQEILGLAQSQVSELFAVHRRK